VLQGSEPREFTPLWRYDPALGTEILVTGNEPQPETVTNGEVGAESHPVATPLPDAVPQAPPDQIFQ
jgi:hypothetical protein